MTGKDLKTKMVIPTRRNSSIKKIKSSKGIEMTIEDLGLTKVSTREVESANLKGRDLITETVEIRMISMTTHSDLQKNKTIMKNLKDKREELCG